MPDSFQLEHLALLLLWVYSMRLWWRVNRRWVKGWWQRAKDHLPIHRHPKSPKDCPHCCQGIHLEKVHVKRDVRPWREVKSKRGRKKQYATQGWACLNRTCAYYGIMDETIHALVRHTSRGKDRDIPYLRCQCCQTVFTSRKGTPLYTLKAKAGQVELVLWFLVEGVDMAVMVRYTGRTEATIARWLERMGTHSQGWHNVLFRGLTLSLVQMDELYAKVKDSEQARWLWLVIDPVTKVIPTLHLGGRKSIDAYAVAHDLKERLIPDCVPGVMTDGLWMYFYALTAHFGYWFRPKRARTDHWQPDERLNHAQLVKRTVRRCLKYTVRRMAWGKRAALFAVLQANGFRRVIQTAFIERLNLTFRQGIAGLARDTWSLMGESHLLLHAEWFRLYYHLARPHESLREPVPGFKRKYRARTPAMAAGITDRVLTVGDILRMPLVPAVA